MKIFTRIHRFICFYF